jgi:hypothetical protein
MPHGRVVGRAMQTTREHVCSSLDPSALSREIKTASSEAEARGGSEGGVGGGAKKLGSAAAGLRVVSLVGAMLDAVLASCVELLQVQAVLEKKRDPASGEGTPRRLCLAAYLSSPGTRTWLACISCRRGS